MGLLPTDEVNSDERVHIGSDSDIVLARQKGRELAGRIGFSPTDLVFITTTISELARNIVSYAKTGEVALRTLNHGGRHGILVVASDQGPGIADVEKAMQAGYSTSGSAGLGLPGIRRLMDEVEIQSEVGRGTTVIAKKWKI